MPYPKKFPFSFLVPEVYSQVKEYIYHCLKFSDDLNLRYLLLKLLNFQIKLTASNKCCLNPLLNEAK